MSQADSCASTPTAKTVTAVENGRPQSLYASPLGRRRSYIDLTSSSSPPHAPSNHSTRPNLPSTTSAHTIDKQEERLRTDKKTIFQDALGRRYEYHSPSTRHLEEERGRAYEGWEKSSLPRIQSNLTPPHPSNTTAASLESIVSAYDIRSQGPTPSSKFLAGIAEPSAHSTSSFDSEQVRSLSRYDKVKLHQEQEQQQRSSSVEGAPYKRWMPFTSPLSVNRFSKQYVPTNLNNSKHDSNALPKQSNINVSVDERQGAPSHPMQRSHDGIDRTQSRNHERPAQQSQEESSTARTSAELKRKYGEMERENQGPTVIATDKATSHSHFSSLAPPSSHLYGDVDRSRREGADSGRAVEGISSTPFANSGAAQGPDSMMREQDEREEEVEGGVSRCLDSMASRLMDGKILDDIQFQGAPQRKSCDRCFKMKTKVRSVQCLQKSVQDRLTSSFVTSRTKCSRAAPGTTGEGPCEGCIRRGFGDDCVTSRPDFPYPRITLPKRARRESSLPALMSIKTNDSNVFVPSSIMQRSNDWRTKLIVNSLQQNTEEGRGQQQQSSFSHSSVSTDDHAMSTSNMALKEHSHQLQPIGGPRPSAGLTIKTSPPPPPSSSDQAKSKSKDIRHHLAPYMTKLRTLPTAELEDLGSFIAYEVSQRTQTRPLKTPVVPSNPRMSQATTLISSSTRTAATMSANTNLVSQAMHNAPMQLLPKAVGLPALEYFEEMMFPLLPLPVLSSKSLLSKYENYVKPGRNNIIELVVAIALQLQGVSLSCSNKSQANTAEGRIFKSFLQYSSVQQEQQHHQHHQATASNGNEAKVCIDSIKGWIEPGRHRSRAKEIVKHVILRRCLKNGLDYDDVLENVLLAHFCLLRGNLSGYHIYTGTARRQIALLGLQQQTFRDGLWSEEDARLIQCKVLALERLHPIQIFAPPSPPTTCISGEQFVKTDFATLQGRLSEIAAFVQKEHGTSEDSKPLIVEVDLLLAKLQSSLPSRLQGLVPASRVEESSSSSDVSKMDVKWISEAIHSSALTPSLRLSVCLNVAFIRLAALQEFIPRALKDFIPQALKRVEESDAPMLSPGRMLNKTLHLRLADCRHVASAVLSSTLQAITLYPHLACLFQFYVAEVTSCAWNYVVSHLLLSSGVPSFPSSTEEQRIGFNKVKEGLSQLLTIALETQEKEAWPYAASLQMLSSILQDVSEGEDGTKGWLSIMQTFGSSNKTAFHRLLMGDPWAVDALRKERKEVHDKGDVRKTETEQEREEGREDSAPKVVVAPSPPPLM
ncbi:hypothetical protein CBS101457_005310 [Exobasidium rhododendri]|nr:hypothetical protein CBS101457_005310 [Exobasidium rhododendri]